MKRDHTPRHVHVVHNKVPGRIRLRLHREHRHPLRMEDIRRSLLDDLGDLVRSIEINPTTGSILIHHHPHESWGVQLALALERLGLEIVLDNAVAVDGTRDSAVMGLALVAAAHGVNHLIDRMGWKTLHRVFFGARILAYLRRIFNNGLQLGPLAAMLFDVAAEFGLLPAVLAII